MGNKGNNRHMKGLTAPRYLDIGRKQSAYVIKARGGRHSLARSIALSLLIRKLKLANTAKEAGSIIKSGKIIVNRNVIRDVRFNVGLNDIVEIPEAKKCYSISIDGRAHIDIKETAEPDYKDQLFKVVGKYKTDGDNVMLRLHDGSAVKAAGNKTMVNDSVSLNEKHAISKVLSLQDGAQCFVIDGVHVGTTGLVKSITKGTMQTEASVLIKPREGDEFETLVKNIMVIG
jgi:small subunit ribosomal protein S4e